ncbi:threonine ammonia-lyase [Novosphingobium album (ex Liu et al. 2023)]|uniref:Threonine ammonia-lyase n=1 Tax=Novosphingobium album (ex Liu et al. 2023) TaxID=3031130 RepID=A0ABT5WSE4_9SPHN|nr:threonine ammonia-lyase [Novosphingobium album (ex Liu et al. 2023)]MDE8652167.1 threonine ammonia-lyase [Novosphingobium album (ex Liu et al. 2023)]
MLLQPPSIEDIRAAAERLAGAILDTPCLPSETLSAITGTQLFLKFENLQFTASFKERGALNRLLLTDPVVRTRGVCAMSAGNHAQGVAYHARRLGVAATIVMPVGTPLTKIARTRDHGARVVIEGANLSEALAIAHDLATAEGLTFIHPYDDPAVIAGQGTIGLEIIAAVPDLDAIVVPIGGGGMISGIAIAAKQIKPAVQVIGVQSRTYPSMARALAGESDACPDGMTIAEGIAVKTAGVLTREVVRALVDDILLVGESDIEAAIALLLSVEKTVVEGAGAAGLAAVLAHRDRFVGKRVATVLSGGNIDLRVLASVAMRELVRSGRLLRFEVPISDAPGVLACLTGVCAATTTMAG